MCAELKIVKVKTQLLKQNYVHLSRMWTEFCICDQHFSETENNSFVLWFVWDYFFWSIVKFKSRPISTFARWSHHCLSSRTVMSFTIPLTSFEYLVTIGFEWSEDYINNKRISNFALIFTRWTWSGVRIIATLCGGHNCSFTGKPRQSLSDGSNNHLTAKYKNRGHQMGSFTTNMTPILRRESGTSSSSSRPRAF